MSKCIYLAWQDQTTRGWHVIGQLLRTNEGYEFRYTNGVKNILSFSALPSMPQHDGIYRSTELFSLFKNRLMPRSRPDYADYMNWLGINPEDPIDELEALAVSGGERETDFFRIIPVPEKNANGDYSFKFFVNGMSHASEEAINRVNALHNGDRLYLMHDFQNEKDKLAIAFRTEDPPCLIGYIPAYFTKVIHTMVNENKSNQIVVSVMQVNKDAPMQMRLLCEFSSASLNRPWEEYEDEFKLVT